MTEQGSASKFPISIVRKAIRTWWFRFTHRAPVPVYDVTDEDLDDIEAERAKKRTN